MRDGVGGDQCTEIRGRKKTVYWAFDQYINFYAKFSKPFTYTMVTDSMALDEGGPLLPTAKVLLHFNTKANEEVYVKVGISAVSMEGARKNVEAEIRNGILKVFVTQPGASGIIIFQK